MSQSLGQRAYRVPPAPTGGAKNRVRGPGLGGLGRAISSKEEGRREPCPSPGLRCDCGLAARDGSLMGSAELAESLSNDWFPGLMSFGVGWLIWVELRPQFLWENLCARWDSLGRTYLIRLFLWVSSLKVFFCFKHSFSQGFCLYFLQLPK